VTRDSQVSLVRSFSQADFNCFARLSGDDNPIHVDLEFSAHTRFGRPVAHGLLLCSVLRGLVEKLIPGGRLADQSVMFSAPTFIAEPMRFTVTEADTDKTGTRVKLEVLRIADGTVTCQGHCKVLK
jgi:acyl dehydratase